MNDLTEILKHDGYKLAVLERGTCEPLKALVHGTTLGLAVIMGAYNAAAWFQRREPHLAINAVLYAALIAWEREHVARHLKSCQPLTGPTEESTGGPANISADAKAA